jgi:hypothetical protein
MEVAGFSITACVDPDIEGMTKSGREIRDQLNVHIQSEMKIFHVNHRIRAADGVYFPASPD